MGFPVVSTTRPLVSHGSPTRATIEEALFGDLIFRDDGAA